MKSASLTMAFIAFVLMAAEAQAQFVNHPNIDIPKCGTLDAPVCGVVEVHTGFVPEPIHFEGELPATVTPGPFTPCENGVQFDMFHCVFKRDVVGDLIDYCREQFDDGSCKAIEVGKALVVEEECDTLFCDGGTPEPWTESWWHRGNHDRSDADRDERTGEPDDEQSADQPADQPDQADPPADDSPSDDAPANDTPENCSND
ncbi:MAG: hypothetical protein ACR2QF_09155 [Geminicoccaceae bacterium]